MTSLERVRRFLRLAFGGPSCPGGGTGRRAGFRYQWSNSWRFESSPGHSAVVRRRPSPSILPANYLIIFNFSFDAVRTVPVHLRALPYNSGPKKGFRMTKPICRDLIYRRRVFDPGDHRTVRLAGTSPTGRGYRDLVDMTTERGSMAAHSNSAVGGLGTCRMVRSVMHRFSRPVGTLGAATRRISRFECVAYYLYLLSTITYEILLMSSLGRDHDAFWTTLSYYHSSARRPPRSNLNRWPRKVTLDGHVPSHRALRLLRREDPKWRRKSRYERQVPEPILLSRTISRRRTTPWPPWPALSRSAMRPSPLPESSWRTAFNGGVAHLASVTRVASAEGAADRGARRLSIAETRFRSFR